jgi:hypothetical protein
VGTHEYSEVEAPQVCVRPVFYCALLGCRHCCAHASYEKCQFSHHSFLTLKVVAYCLHPLSFPLNKLTIVLY